jgi:pimeloyl-ACP methyl ester carboxylesterase
MEVEDHQIALPNGISAQVLSSLPSKPSTQPPLVFLHGSFHAAWCWKEIFFSYFVSLGYPVIAYSWRGTSGTFAGEGVKKIKAAQHMEDLQGFLDQIPFILGPEYANNNCKPIIVSHSFGGILFMKYLEGCDKKPSSQFSGIITMCSVPPSGYGKMAKRQMWRSFSHVWKIIKAVPMKKATTDALLCRELFFGGEPRVRDDGTVDDYGVSDDDIARYQGHFARDTKATVDTSDLAKHLPSKNTDSNGRAPFVSDLPPVLVIGATYDFLVDFEGNLETAKYYGLEEPVLVDSPHDVMLGRKWQNCAGTIHHWIQESIVPNNGKS